MNKISQLLLFLGLVIALSLGGCKPAETATPTAPQDQAAAQANAAEAAKKSMAADLASQKAQEADAARRKAAGIQ